MTKSKKAKYYIPIIVSLILLFNANIRTIDLLPDFIAYIIILRMLSKVTLRAPYFHEAAEAVKNLLIITVLKLPSQLFISMVQSQNVRDNDIVVLSTLVFSVLEAIFIIKAIKYLFDALFYVGQRTNATSLITPFPVTKKHSATPEGFRMLTLTFFIAKTVLVLIPEMLLLTKTVEIGSQTPVFNPATLYSETLLVCLIIVTVLGIVWLVQSIKYLNFVVSKNNIFEEICSLASDNEKEEISKRELVRSHSMAMNIIIAASVLSIELVFDNFHGINLLPSFIFVSVIVLGNYILHKRKALNSVVTGILFCIASVTAYAMLINFLTEFGYGAMIGSTAAREEYMNVIVASAVELLLFTVIIIFNCVNMYFYIYHNTGLSPQSDRYMLSDKRYHKNLIKKNFVYTFTAFLVGVTKFLNVLLKYTVDNYSVEMPDNSTATMLVTAVPWFNLVVLCASAIFIGYSFYFWGTLKEEINLKYNYTE